MNDRSTSVFVCLTVLLAVACHASAQSKKNASKVLNGWDRNRNGLLEKSEIPVAARSKFEVLAKRKGLDLDKGLSIKKLLAKDDVKSRKGAKVAEEKSVNDALVQQLVSELVCQNGKAFRRR